MEVLIRECPACRAVVMGDESRCNECGKDLTPEIPPDADRRRTMVSPAERSCPKCGLRVPLNVLRCRDCGAYMDPEIEAAMLARQMTRSQIPGAGRFGGYASPAYGAATSSFAEVADDADFDLNPDVDFRDPSLQRMIDRPTGADEHGDDLGDDFELQAGQSATAADAAVSEPETRPPAPDLTPLPPAGAIAELGAALGEGAAVLGEAGVGAAIEVPHSVQTGGDVLLDAALEEERDTQLRQKSGRRRLRRSTTTVLGPDRCLVFCPNGHRIQVHTKHRGRSGRCPNCRARFFVPLSDEGPQADADGSESTAGPNGAAPAPQASEYVRWMTDVRLHRLNPAKLKLRPGSLEDEFEAADLGASPEHLLLAVVYSGGGPFRAMQGPKKKAAMRQAMLEHLAQQLPLADLPVARHYPLSPDQLQQLKIVQPPVPGEESVFADVPVFGRGRIAVRVPAADLAGERAYLSFTITQFREFSALLSDSYGLAEFGAGTEIPMTDEFQQATCHYSEAALRALPPERLPYYKSDPAIKLIVVGRRCQKCGLVVSEDSRKKEKIGGSSDSSIARARCPKCKQKFGTIALYGLPG